MAWANTEARGTRRKNPRKRSATPVKSQRIDAGSVSLRPGVLSLLFFTVSCRCMVRLPFRVPSAPPLEEVDDEQKEKRGAEHHRGDGRGTGVVVLFQLGYDEERGD